jgi:hypothetical protein
MREDKGLAGMLTEYDINGIFSNDGNDILNGYKIDYNYIMKALDKITSITTSNTPQQNITTLANDGGPITTAVWPTDSTPNQMTLTNNGSTQTQSNWSNTGLSVEKRKGVTKLKRWVECSPNNEYKIGGRNIEAYIVLDQLKKILIIDSYDRTDKALLNDLRTLYIRDNGSK